MRLLITAGPTREPIDAVRFVSNRSSGKIGLAIAQAAVTAGHDVTLLLGPGPERSQEPQGCRVYRFESSVELQQLLEAHWPDQQALIMAAAVADYRPVQVLEGKLERKAGELFTITLGPVPDLVAMCAASRKPGQTVVAFALEDPARLEERATRKLQKKGVDAIVANPLGTMESDLITPLWMTALGTRLAPGRMSKRDFAPWLLDRVTELATTTQTSRSPEN